MAPDLTDAPMLAAVHYDRGANIDHLLAGVCRQLVREGIRLGGLMQLAAGAGGDEACAGTVEVVDVASGQRFGIFENRGACSQGCRLDERGLVAALPGVLASIDAGIELLVLNRFGRAEARGGGLQRALIAAIEAGVPILTAVRAPYEESWQAFHAGAATALPPAVGSIVDWCRRVTGKQMTERPAAALPVSDLVL